MHCKIILCALVLAGCSNNFDPASFVSGLRVLAVKAEPPELAPGETATLTPLVIPTNPDADGGSSDADGGVTSWHADWWLCRETPTPGRSVGNDCVAADAGTSLVALGSGTSMQVTMPDVSPAELGIPDDTGGLYLPVLLHVSDGTTTIPVVYRLRYSLLPFFKNHNPTIDDVELVPDKDGGPPASLDQTMELHLNDQIHLRASVKPGSSEQYPLLEGVPPDLGVTFGDGGIMFTGMVSFFDGGVDVNGTDITLVDELLPVAWFSTIGSLDPDTTTAYRPDLPDAKQKSDLVDSKLKLDQKHTPAAPANIDLWVVVRDGRGGTDWTHRQLLLR